MADILDVLSDKKKVEEIATAETSEKVREKLKEEGVEVTSEDVKNLGKVFDAASKQLDESALENIGGSFGLNIGWKSLKAKMTYKIITQVVGLCVATGLIEYKKGWFSTKSDTLNDYILVPTEDTPKQDTPTPPISKLNGKGKVNQSGSDLGYLDVDGSVIYGLGNPFE